MKRYCIDPELDSIDERFNGENKAIRNDFI